MNDASPPDDKTISMAILAIVLVMVVMFGVASLVVHQREQACAEKCREAGFMSYDYAGFTGGLRRLHADRCTCTRPGQPESESRSS